MSELGDILPELSTLDQALGTQDFPSEDGLLSSSVLDELCYFTDMDHQSDFSSLLDLDASQPLCQPNNVLPYSLSYCTPPYSPSSTGSTAEEPSSGICSAPVLPVGTAPPAGFVGQTAVKTEAPSSSETCAQTEWMSTLLMPPALTCETPLESGSRSPVPSPAVPTSTISKEPQTVLSQSLTFNASPQGTQLEMIQASLKRQERLRKNRESSCVSRKKRKVYLETLEDRLKEAATKNAALMTENNLLRKKLSSLESENKRLQAIVTHESDKPSGPGRGGFATMTIVLLLGFSLGFVSFQRPLWSASPTAHDPFAVDVTAVGPLRMHRRLLSMDDVEVIPVAQRTRPWSKALAVRRTEVAPASPQKSDNAVTSHIAVGKEASKSLTRELRKCFDLWENKKQGQDPYSVSSAVIESCKELLSQLESNPNLDLAMTRSAHDGNVLGSQSSLESFVQGFKRDMERYYIVSFKDHVLLSAPERNHSTIARMSVIVPSANATASRDHSGVPLVQIDCTVDALTYFQWEKYS